MATLREIICADDKAERVFRDCEALLDDEVAKKGGVSGLAVKGGYKVVRAIKPGFVSGVIRDLVPEFCDALEGMHETWGKEKKGSFGAYLAARDGEVAKNLLTVTDGKAQGSTNRVVKKTYEKLRPAAERNVRDAVPGLSKLLDKHYA